MVTGRIFASGWPSSFLFDVNRNCALPLARAKLAAGRFVVDPGDPRAPSQALWDSLSDAELPIYYPDEAMFAPDLIAVVDVETHERRSWVVSQEKKGLDFVLEINVSGDQLQSVVHWPAGRLKHEAGEVGLGQLAQ